MNLVQKSWEALLWDIVANSISGWVQLLMDLSSWVTALIQVRESESQRAEKLSVTLAMYYVCDTVSVVICVFSDGVFCIIDLLRVDADTASQQGCD